MEQKKIEIRELIASEGKVLTDGTTYAKVVYLAPSAKVEDWWEVDEEDVPQGTLEEDNEQTNIEDNEL